MKTVSFAIPCYNSAAYMDKCIESILACDFGDRGDIEIIIVDDGSTKDDTAEKADEWQRRYPDTIVAIHQENGGHGAAVNAGLANATGRYFKVVDSDDWLDEDAMRDVMAYLRRQCELKDSTDLIIANYVYEKVHEGTRTVMRYRNVFPEGREFTWDETGHFNQSQYLLMHSVIYRTELLRDCGLKLPEHTFMSTTSSSTCLYRMSRRFTISMWICIVISSGARIRASMKRSCIRVATSSFV